MSLYKLATVFVLSWGAARAFSFGFTQTDHLNAVLMSTGLMPENKTFMRTYYEHLYGITFPAYGSGDEYACPCRGCEVEDVCITCIDEEECFRLQGFFCD